MARKLRNVRVRMRVVPLCLGLSILASLVPGEPLRAAPAGFSVVADNDVAREPVDLAWRPGDEAFYIVSKGGRVVRLDGAGATDVLDLSDAVSTGGEQGLLGLVFSADGALAYVNFTDVAGDTVVAELPVSPEGVLDRTAMRVLLTIDQPKKNHNGGDLAVGPDGYLYIPTGDGGGAGDPDRRAMDLTSPLGKILRIDPTPGDGTAYTIPADNPYVGQDGALGEIWSIGLRNPWRVAFDPVTGDLWIADVGQSRIEEVNVAPAVDGLGAARGLNFGWSAFEGHEVFNDDLSAPDHFPPVFTYEHSGDRCSISGGARARGPGAGSYDGSYVFADYCSSEMTVLAVTGEGAAIAVSETVVLAGPERPFAVIAGPDGTIYVLARNGVNRLDPP